ncbi:hypothetical protein IW146_010301 [Coemansia sp. RSA 922]|nr:hypothetical protein GGI14_000306 [Coemansia sp. S680]KAJ2044154.1 hypothetical protein GGI08_007187 [Coemansia sp. S2]KAJ2096834.1 hypothetical protein IW146_010301 [Coemansia sp. RSA 922]
MSPAANSATELANVSYSPANFASIFAVLTTFVSVIPSNVHEPEELHSLVTSTESTDQLKDLSLNLLASALNRKPKARPSEDQWPRHCTDLAATYVFLLKGLEVPEEAADSLDGFVQQTPTVRVDFLYWLCEIALMDNSSIKQLVDTEAEKGRKTTNTTLATNDSLVRLQPFAEISKQRYWLFGSKTRQFYLESVSQKGKGKFELLAQTVDEFASAAADLRAQRYNAPKELGGRLVSEVIPYLEAQVKKRCRVERALQRHAIANAHVHVYETRTRKRQRVNYNDDQLLDALDF